MLVPQDSYVTVLEADAYHSIRPSATTWAALSEPDKAMRLVAATDYIDSQFQYSGKKTDAEQVREFPRNGKAEVPQAVKKAVFELALQSDLTANPEQSVKKEKVAVLEVEYFEADDAQRFAYIYNLLKPFLLSDKRIGAIVAFGQQKCCSGLWG